MILASAAMHGKTPVILCVSATPRCRVFLCSVKSPKNRSRSRATPKNNERELSLKYKYKVLEGQKRPQIALQSVCTDGCLNPQFWTDFAVLLVQQKPAPGLRAVRRLRPRWERATDGGKLIDPQYGKMAHKRLTETPTAAYGAPALRSLSVCEHILLSASACS